MKILVATYHRASDGALTKLIDKMKEEDMYTDEYDKADCILIPGDREETYDVALRAYKDNKKIIHLWAGDISPLWETHNDVYRHSITLMSHIQLCTNDIAKDRVKKLCKSVDKIYFVVTVGNVMIDNIKIDESDIPNEPYDLILYNPPTRLTKEEIFKEIEHIQSIKKERNYIWITPNGDKFSDIIYSYQTHDTLPREKFLGLMKHCDRFITNSSCQYYEAPFLLKPEQIISIGKRNIERESKYSNMSIPNASENIMQIFRSLE